MSISNGCYSLYIYVKSNIVASLNGCDFLLNHGDEYQIGIFNHGDSSIDAEVLIDGKKIGTFRVNRRDRIVIDRPERTNRKLTFLNLNSVEGRMGGLKHNNPKLGYVEVRIVSGTTERLRSSRLQSDGCGGGGIHYSRNDIEVDAHVETADGDDDDDHPGLMTGDIKYVKAGTALGKPSNQQFRAASYLIRDDKPMVVLVGRLRSGGVVESPAIVPL